jgi:hypothetical protein
MALVYRNGRPYSYKSVRRNGRVTSEYRGSGEAALLIGLLDAERQEERACRAELDREERRRFDDLEEALDELAERGRALAREALTAAGFYQHKRGEWRRRRGKRSGES